MPGSAQRVRDCGELSGNCCDDDLMRFASSAKTVGEDLQGWIVVAGGEGCLEHHMPHQAPPAGNGTLAALAVSDGRLLLLPAGDA